MNETLDGVFHYYQTAISLRSYRQEVLASNIANADTPGYKAQDFDFGNALNTALKQPSASMNAQSGNVLGGLAMTQAGHLPTNPALSLSDTGHLPGNPVLDPVGHAMAQASAKLQYRIPSQDSADGNTVDMDVERTQFANNAIHYEANLTLLTGRIKDLIAATTS
jgi:flagellar basal-body rod protein FlgB